MIRENIKLIAFSMVGGSLILALIKFAAAVGIPWWIVLAPIWLPLLILLTPWLLTVALLWIEQRKGG